MSVSALSLIERAFADLGAIGVGDTLTSVMAQDGLRRLNSLVNTLNTQDAALVFQAREVFDTVANVNTYTMGPGGDFDTTRPSGLLGAGLLLMSSNPPVEIPRALLTDNAYQALQIKDLKSPLWTHVYFNPTYDNNLATVFLWPTPTTAQNKCVLYRLATLAGFTDLTTQYDFPYGYEEMFEYNLAMRLARPYGIPISAIPDIQQLAVNALRLVKRTNHRINDAPQDLAFVSDRKAGYNIVTGQGGF